MHICTLITGTGEFFELLFDDSSSVTWEEKSKEKTQIGAFQTRLLFRYKSNKEFYSMSISMDQIKQLREKTGAGVMDAKKALEESNGDMDKAAEWVRQRGLAKAAKKADREAKEGIIASYVHMNKVASIVEINCETDFVARNEEFLNMGREVAMQVASMAPESVEELLKQQYNRNPKQTIEELVKELSGKIGEKMEIKRFVRYAIGEWYFALIWKLTPYFYGCSQLNSFTSYQPYFCTHSPSGINQ